MKRFTIAVIFVVTSFAGASFVTSTLFSSQVVVKAQKEKDGKQVATPNGTLICDCTATKDFHCKCIVAADPEEPINN